MMKNTIIIFFIVLSACSSSNINKTNINTDKSILSHNLVIYNSSLLSKYYTVNKNHYVYSNKVFIDLVYIDCINNSYKFTIIIKNNTGKLFNINPKIFYYSVISHDDEKRYSIDPDENIDYIKNKINNSKEPPPSNQQYESNSGNHVDYIADRFVDSLEYVDKKSKLNQDYKVENSRKEIKLDNLKSITFSVYFPIINESTILIYNFEINGYSYRFFYNQEIIRE
jgi:hypothetical protein